MDVGISFLKCRTAKLLGMKQPGFGVYPGNDDAVFNRDDHIRMQVANGDMVTIRLITGLACSIKTRKLYYVAVLI